MNTPKMKLAVITALSFPFVSNAAIVEYFFQGTLNQARTTGDYTLNPSIQSGSFFTGRVVYDNASTTTPFGSGSPTTAFSILDPSTARLELAFWDGADTSSNIVAYKLTGPNPSIQFQNNNSTFRDRFAFNDFVTSGTISDFTSGLPDANLFQLTSQFSVTDNSNTAITTLANLPAEIIFSDYDIGSITLAGNGNNNGSTSSYNISGTITNFDQTPVPVPEPTSTILVGVGLLSLLGKRRRR